MVGSFSLLPSEVLSLILDNVKARKHLYQCTLVNKQFYATTVARLWRARKVAGGYGPRRMLKGLLSAQQHRHVMLGDHIRTLYMDYHPRADVMVESLIVYTPFLEQLNLLSSYGYVVPKPSDLVWRSCPRLVEVYFDNVLLDNLASLASNCPHIRQLTISQLSGASDNIFQPLLTFNDLTVLTVLDYEPINSYRIASTISQLHQLERLEIINSTRDKNAFGQLLHTASHPETLPNLKIIRLFGEGKYYAKEVILFLATHPLLETIDVYMTSISNLFFSSVAGHPNLCTMRLLSGAVKGLEGDYIRSMVIACPRLTTLWLPRGRYTIDRCFPKAANLYYDDFFCLDSLTIASIRQNSDLHVIDQAEDD
ncbi:hypothetical protein [Absidia glauca]|uniref:Uncharacterized protein n=1 Tax=Absidia glauca TaxID=4829 RepID=A0A168LXC4_ABSGL|nr:hypothetical protein [Absidia glauca]